MLAHHRVAGGAAARRLTGLALSGEAVTDRTLADLRAVRGLERLLLAYTSVTDDGLAHLRDLRRLKRLHIRSGRITDAGIGHLRALPALELLQIPSTPGVTDAAVAALREARPGLTVETLRAGDGRAATRWDDGVD